MNRVVFSSNRQDWETPQPLFDTLNSKYHFTLDAAASPSNTKCAVYYDEDQDGLSQNWGGGILSGAILHMADRLGVG